MITTIYVSFIKYLLLIIDKKKVVVFLYNKWS
jgi:hypothetical protein